MDGSNTTSRTERTSPVAREFDELARAAAGALLFGVPLLLTMEMWWLGESIGRGKLLALLVLAFGLNVALAHLSGFRDAGHTLANDAAQALEAMAIGLVTSVAILGALGVIDGDSSLRGALGAVAIQVVPLSIGASIAGLVFAPGRSRSGDEDSARDRGTPLEEFRSDLLATIVGAVFVGVAVAPTEEVAWLAAGLDLSSALTTVALALGATWLIVFASGFDPSHHAPHEGGIFQGPFSETTFTFGVSLAVSAFLLAAFGQVSADDPLRSLLAQSLVLAVPASIGGAAGRVVV